MLKGQDPATPPEPSGGASLAASEGVKAVTRALDILECLTSAESRTLGELAQATGLPPGTAHRLLRTLVARGFVRQGSARRYSLGARLIPMGAAAGKALGPIAQPRLAELAATFGESANLAVLDGDAAAYIAQAASPFRLRIFAEVGRRVLLHCTAVGKVLLASRPDQEVAAMVQRTGLPAHTPNTITRANDLDAELCRVRLQGFAVDAEEEEIGVSCVAVPVQDGKDVIAALSVSGPTGRVRSLDQRALVAELQRVAEQLAVGDQS